MRNYYYYTKAEYKNQQIKYWWDEFFNGEIAVSCHYPYPYL